MAVIWTAIAPHGRSETVADHAVGISAVVQTNPAQITLSWAPDANATACRVYRKSRDVATWGFGTALSAEATNYVDTAVGAGAAYEYRVSRTSVTPTTNYVAEGYIYAGIQVRFADSQGKVLLLVDRTQAGALGFELDRLERDLIGDGWVVARSDVGRTDSPASIGSLIRSAYAADSGRVKAVFLVGHVPVPYSGDFNPDGHPDHVGAWPADVYYGDVNGVWTDARVNDTSAASSRNRNLPGDGKFDPDTVPSPIELMVGRVDLSGLPTFPATETELLRRYLDKDHAFRHQAFRVPARAIIDDNFGVFGGEAFGINGWRNFVPICGATSVSSADWLAASTGASLLAYGCGAGSYTSASGVADTGRLASGELRSVFTLLFGSYFGDWDSPDNLLRAVLASSPSALTSGWAGRPHWVLHFLGLGESIGYCVRATQNNSGVYDANYFPQGVHVALMGDPTLRPFPVAPPAQFLIQSNDAGGLRLMWRPSSDVVAGYHIYRANAAAGPFARITPSLILTNEYVDTNGAGQTYMVRAVKLETTASGTFFNPSQGVFQDAAGGFGPPPLQIAIGSDGRGMAVLSWPRMMTGYHLESAPAILGDWLPVSGTPTNAADGISVSVPLDGEARYFRLREP